MRFGNQRGVALAFAVTCFLAASVAGSARADLFHTIPREVDAVDVNNGGPYFAPPIPYGHYAKDCLGGVHKICSSLFGALHGCGACGGAGCGACGGTGRGLCGGLGRGQCGDPGCGGVGDPGCGKAGRGWGSHCGLCNGNGCGFCQGRALLHGHRGKGHGCTGHASTIAASGQSTPAPSAQSPCGLTGCGLKSKHSHRGRGLLRACGSCRGSGCGLCGGNGFFGGQDPCGNCGGNGCGLCRNGGFGDPCNACGGRGCGMCGGRGCGMCGGRGCGLCGGGHSLLGGPKALVNKVLHRGYIKYFVGPGGPVPITPGYVPYIVTTRSPREFFSFPPMAD